MEQNKEPVIESIYAMLMEHANLKVRKLILSWKQRQLLSSSIPQYLYLNQIKIWSKVNPKISDLFCAISHSVQSLSFPILPDHMYIATFKATGCTNDQPHTGWWKSQSEETVLNDMFKYCELTKDGSGSGGQKSQCCGSEDCTVTECVKQTGWKKGILIKK